MSRLKFAIGYLVTNGAILALAYLAFFERHDFAANLFPFATGVLLLLSVLTLAASSKADVKAKIKASAVPSWARTLPDVVLAVVCAGFGAFWLAAAWTWMAFVSGYVGAIQNEKEAA